MTQLLWSLSVCSIGTSLTGFIGSSFSDFCKEKDNMEHKNSWAVISKWMIQIANQHNKCHIYVLNYISFVQILIQSLTNK